MGDAHRTGRHREVSAEIKRHFGANGHIGLFGSPADGTGVGGDFDLFVEAEWAPPGVDAVDLSHSCFDGALLSKVERLGTNG